MRTRRPTRRARETKRGIGDCFSIVVVVVSWGYRDGLRGEVVYTGQNGHGRAEGRATE